MEGKLVKNAEGRLDVELDADGKPKYRGSGKDLTYRDDLTNERFMPHVIEPSAGADRGTLAFLCEAYHEDQAPDENGEMQTRVGDEVPPAARADQGGRLPAGEEGRHARGGPGDLPRSRSGSSRSTTRKGRSAAATAARTKPARRICITVDGQTLQDRRSRSATATRSNNGA